MDLESLAISSKFKVLGQFAVYQCACKYSVPSKIILLENRIILARPATNGVIIIDRIDGITSLVERTASSWLYRDTFWRIK